MKTSKSITRTIHFYEEKFLVSTESFYFGQGCDKWFNCLYLKYCKEDFPNIESPALVEGWEKGTVRFEYNKSAIAELGWHCGITYYSENKDLETGRTLVKAGCDYQHLGDDIYSYQDSGESILKYDGIRLAEEFKEKFLNKQKEN